MYTWLIIFLISCFILFYNYAGYAFIAAFFNIFSSHKKKFFDDSYTPSVSFIVAAFNEESFIEEKIINSLAQNYPPDKIEFIFVTDGSSDGTVSIVQRYPAIKLMHSSERRGKSAAINRAVESAHNEILIFSDANTNLNADATRNIVRHYAWKNTGGVAGEKKVLHQTQSANEVSAGEGLYWKYESVLKQIDSDFYSVVGAAGELFSVRKELYLPIAPNVILDDFIISLKTAAKGYRIVYEPNAFAMESPSFSIRDEQKRKVRIAAGGHQSIVMLRSLFLFWKYPRLSFLYISHRVLRWTLSPLCLILAFVSNFILFLGTNSIILAGVFWMQVIFYLMAILSATVPSANRIKVFKIPYYFTFMNVSVILGFFRFLRGSQSAIWEKVKRAEPAISKS